MIALHIVQSINRRQISMRNRLSLLWVVVGNLLLTSLLSAIAIGRLSRSLSWAYVDCIFLGQAAVAGMVAALLPHRRFAGIGVILVLAILQACLNSLIQLALNIQFWPIRSGLFFDAYMFFVATVFLAFRYLRGWRLTFQESAEPRVAGQFSLLDIVEWTTFVAVMLGYYAAMARISMRLSLVDLAVMLPWAVLTLIPAVPVVFARSRLGLLAVALLGAWSIATCVASWLTDLRIVSFAALLPSWKIGATFSAWFLAALFGNLIILRWTGLRLNRPSDSPPRLS